MTFFKLINNEKANQFISIIKTLKLFNDYISFFFNSDKLYIQGMDNSHICLYEVNIDKDWFDEYNYSSNESQIIVSCMSNIINKILNLYKTNETLVIGFNDDNMDNIFINMIINNDNNLTNNKEFEINCIDIDFESLSPDEIDYDIDLYFTSKEFSNYCNELMNFGEELQIFCYNNLIKLKSNNNESSMVQNIDMNLILKYDAIDDFKIYNKFQINYINYICNLQKAFSQIKISVQYGLPINIFFNTDDDLLNVRFFLAPKVEDDCDDNNYSDDIEEIFNSMK